jgi:hypothetical protein
LLDGTRAPILTSLELDNHYGFAQAVEETAFDQTPVIVLFKSISGPIAMDDGYTLSLTDSIVDAGSGPGEAVQGLAVGAATGDPLVSFGPDLQVNGVTCFGRMRVETATGQGALWTGKVQAQDDQKGCLRFCWFGARGNRLPPNHACVFTPEAKAAFVSSHFGDPGYAQLSGRADRPILEQGPEGEEIGAFGYLRNTSKRKNIRIRTREFMPAGIVTTWVTVT